MGGGGGSQETITVDPAYNAGMLKLSQEQQGWAKEMFNMFKFGTLYDPYEVDPKTGKTYGELNDYKAAGVTSEMEYLQNLVEANQDLLGLQKTASAAGLTAATSGAEFEKALYSTRKSLLPAQKGLISKGIQFQSSFLDEAGRGVDTKKWMDQAQAGVQHGYKLANEEFRRDIASYGLDPTSGRYASQMRTAKLGEAAGIAGARTAAERTAELEDFRRKQIAAQGLTIPTL